MAVWARPTLWSTEELKDSEADPEAGDRGRLFANLLFENVISDHHLN